MKSTKEKYQKVKSLEELKTLDDGSGEKEWLEVFIVLNSGLRSSKRVSYDQKRKKFKVVNEIDDSEQELTEKQMMNKNYTNIGYAITENSLFYHNE